MTDVLSESYDVCMITTRHPLRDHRVYHKEAVSLARELGLRVLVIAISERETIERDGSIVVLGIRGSQLHILRSVLRVLRVLPRVRARVFHIHDFEALVLLPYLKYVRRVPVIYDVHEHYDLMIRNVVALPDAVREPLARVVDVYERVFARMSDQLILVEEPQKPRFFKFSIPERRMTVVRNLASIASFNPAQVQKEFDLVYCGTCYAARGIFEMIEAVELARREGRAIKMLLMLSGKPDELAKAKAKIAELDLAREITVRTHVPYDEVPAGLASARVGVALFHDAPGHRIAIPTKLVEYGAAGLPAIVNDVNRFSIEYIERYKAGVVIHGHDARSILGGLSKIERDYEAFAERARHAAKENCWEAEEGKLVALYRELLAVA